VPAKHAAILVEPDRMVHAYEGAAVAEVYFASHKPLNPRDEMRP
jgi:hypothetical protein